MAKAQDGGTGLRYRHQSRRKAPLPSLPLRTHAITRLCTHFCTPPGSHFAVLTPGASRGCQRCSPHPESSPPRPVLLLESKCCVNGAGGAGGGEKGRAQATGNTLPSPPFSHISVLLQQNWGGKGRRGEDGGGGGTHAGAGPSGKGQPQQVWVTRPPGLPRATKRRVGWGGRRGRGQGRRSGAVTS